MVEILEKLEYKLAMEQVMNASDAEKQLNDLCNRPNCLDPDDFESLLKNEVDDLTRASMEFHLSECSLCQTTMESVKAANEHSS